MFFIQHPLSLLELLGNSLENISGTALSWHIYTCTNGLNTLDIVLYTSLSVSITQT